jgi:hypothetical protein
MASSEIGKFIWSNRPASVSQVTGVFLPPLQTAGLRRAQAMTQLSAKILTRRIMIVCLMILIPATGIAIATVPQAEPIKNNVKAYAEPVLKYTSMVGGSIPLVQIVKTLVHKGWKHA